MMVFGPVVEAESEITEAGGPFITSNSLIHSNSTIPWMTGLVSEEGLMNSAGMMLILL